jgi:hypothetical protein
MFYRELCSDYGSNYYAHKKRKSFMWIEECQKALELIKHIYIKAPILITLNWDVEFHVHTYASLLAWELH